LILASTLVEIDQRFTEIFNMFTEICGNLGAHLSFASDEFSYSLPPDVQGSVA
jgi:hypothetical protein